MFVISVWLTPGPAGLNISVKELWNKIFRISWVRSAGGRMLNIFWESRQHDISSVVLYSDSGHILQFRNWQIEKFITLVRVNLFVCDSLKLCESAWVQLTLCDFRWPLVILCHFVWFCATLYTSILFNLTLYDDTWLFSHCLTLCNSVWICTTLGDSLWLCLTLSFCFPKFRLTLLDDIIRFNFDLFENVWFMSLFESPWIWVTLFEYG